MKVDAEIVMKSVGDVNVTYWYCENHSLDEVAIHWYSDIEG